MALTDAITTLVNFATAHIDQCGAEEQIRIYHALALTLPSAQARQAARELAIAQSKVAALQLDFSELLTSPTTATRSARSVRSA